MRPSREGSGPKSRNREDCASGGISSHLRRGTGRPGRRLRLPATGILHFMEVWEYLPYLLCRGCNQPMPLPPARHPDMSQGLGSWPKDGLPRNFICHQCTHVFEYSACELHPPPVPKVAGQKRNIPHNVLCIEMPCDTGNCPSQLRIRILVAAGIRSILDPIEVGALAVAHSIRCDNMHIQNDGTRNGTGISADLDSDWKLWDDSFPQTTE